MSAYGPGFVKKLAGLSAGNIVSTGSITPDTIPLYEPLMAGGEILTAGIGSDIVMGKYSSISLHLVLNLATANAGGGTEPLIPTTPPVIVVVTPDPVTGEPVVVTTPADPLWNFVIMLSELDIATGKTASDYKYPIRPDGLTFSSYPTLDQYMSIVGAMGASGAFGSGNYPLFGKNTLQLNQRNLLPGNGYSYYGYDPTFTGDFTIEAMLLKDNALTHPIGGMNYDALQIWMANSTNTEMIQANLNVNGTGALGIYGYASGTPVGAIPPATFAHTVALNVYYHYCLERYGNILTLYVDGAAVASIQCTYGLINKPFITADYIGQFRITKGVARYKGAFAKPTEPYLLGLPSPTQSATLA